MSLDRRNFLTTCARLGFASTLLPGTLYTLAAEAEDKRITADMIDQAANIAGVPIAPVTLHSNAGKCALGSKYCTQFPEFAELFVLKSRTETDASKKG